MSKSLDTIHLPHPSQLVKRKRSRKLTDPSMNRTQRKRPPDDLFEYHRLQLKQRLSQFDSTFPPAQTEIDQASFNNSENPVDDKTTIQSENEGNKSFQLDHEAIWGETDIWIHHRWKYKKHNTSNKPDLAILPGSKGGTLSILPACNEGTMPLTEGNNILKPRNLQHDDWYEQYKMQTMSTFHGLNKRIQEE
ncbi:hypothetical protein FSP39_007528 [Pinctada imbricata]|uniref:Uncharacterized protein n=1 Tax=Pinctada imbricata TaxID=66713 RepID=A0AA88Y424_PINIB|nr:hypothetical protein FSP39_007528 [Pinctada imbricata]